MSENTIQFIEKRYAFSQQKASWPPIRVPAEYIAQEIERLAESTPGEKGRRSSSIIHPSSQEPGLGFAPGVDITINVLKPGESTEALRQNANQIEFCIQGSGLLSIDTEKILVNKWDVCTIPSMRRYTHHNNGDELWVRLTYTNTPLLEKLGAHYIEHVSLDGAEPANEEARDPFSAEAEQRYTRINAPDIPVGNSGAKLRGYEFLTDIAVVPNNPLHWPWHEVAKHINQTDGDGKRTIMLLYNPATERRNGTTHTFFATISSRATGSENPPARGHRHSSVAINYHFDGAGSSQVDGKTIEWQAGDLLLSAPSWSEHAHHTKGSRTLTVQDHPLHIGMESLIWQERMDGPILTLGSERGQTGYVGPRLAGVAVGS